MDYGPRIRKQRLAKGWTQAELGRRSKIHPNTVARLERDERRPSVQVLQKLVDALGGDLVDIIGKSGERAAQSIQTLIERIERLERVYGEHLPLRRRPKK